MAFLRLKNTIATQKRIWLPGGSTPISQEIIPQENPSLLFAATDHESPCRCVHNIIAKATLDPASLSVIATRYEAAPWRKEGFQEWGADFVGLCKMGKCVIRNLLAPGDMRWSLGSTSVKLRGNNFG